MIPWLLAAALAAAAPAPAPGESESVQGEVKGAQPVEFFESAGGWSYARLELAVP